MKKVKDDLQLYFEERYKKDPEFRKAWEEDKYELMMIKSYIDARGNITQKELSEITGISQANLSRFENGEGNPTLGKLKKIAKGLNCHLKIEFVPINK